MKKHKISQKSYHIYYNGKNSPRLRFYNIKPSKYLDIIYSRHTKRIDCSKNLTCRYHIHHNGTDFLRPSNLRNKISIISKYIYELHFVNCKLKYMTYIIIEEVAFGTKILSHANPTVSAMLLNLS